MMSNNENKSNGLLIPVTENDLIMITPNSLLRNSNITFIDNDGNIIFTKQMSNGKDS